MVRPARVTTGLASVLLAAGLLWASAAGASASEMRTRTISAHDDCDPVTFNAALGAGSCVGHGDTTFATFIAELTRKQRVDAWRFTPDKLGVDPGTTILGVNRGGEAHTFTEVAQFGGGFVAPLNQAAGGLAPRPECTSDPTAKPNAQGLLPPAATALESLVPPGGVFHGIDVPEAGHTDLYQCCIHPWMHFAVTRNNH